jgi:tripartite-type tricarboxylate transporter receptor subunit TctC
LIKVILGAPGTDALGARVVEVELVVVKLVEVEVELDDVEVSGTGSALTVVVGVEVEGGLDVVLELELVVEPGSGTLAGVTALERADAPDVPPALLASAVNR